METREFGRCSWPVREIGLGAWALGGVGYGPVDLAESAACVEAFLEAGGNFIDTARVYGESEAVLGRVLARHPERERIFVCSKSVGQDPAAVARDLEQTRSLLDRDVIDLYYLHFPPDDPDEMRRLLDAFLEHKAAGRIRAVGASIRGAQVGSESVALCRSYIATGAVDAIQVIYSVMRQDNGQIFAEAKAAGVAIVARTVLESGFLTGKFGDGTRFAKHDQRHRWQEKLESVLAACRDYQARFAKPPWDDAGQLAVAFALAPPEVACVIPGGKTPRQIRTNIAAASLPALPDELQGALREAYSGKTVLFNPTPPPAGP